MATNGPVPQFFKVHVPHLSSKCMQIPPAFVEYLLQPLPQKVAIWSHGGGFWNVKLERKPTGVFFTDGWDKFVEDNDLQLGEFLIFTYDGLLTFVVALYGVSGCKETRAGIKTIEIRDDDDDDDDDEDEDEDEDEDDDSGRIGSSFGRYRASGFDSVAKYLQDPLNPFVVIKLRKRIFELRVSCQLVKDYGLKFPKFVHYIDPLGELKAKTTTWADQRVCIKGWTRICRRNKLTANDKIICEFLRCGPLVEFIKLCIIRDAYRAN